MNGNFTIRVYGLILHDRNVLLIDEFQLGHPMTKFPGGGLEYGEGTIDCLRREFREELQQEIKDIEHFYTTDFYQQAQFFENTQLLSIYYSAELANQLEPNFAVESKPDYSGLHKNGDMHFRWCPIENLQEQLSFPIDQKIGEMLQCR
jgi:8-oxo-dGTP diphosphatase